MKQYNIPLGGYKPVEGVIYLLENDLNQINKKLPCIAWIFK